MTFDGQYLTYNDYKTLGGTLEQTPFNLLEYNARKKIDERTFGRLIGIEEVPQEVQLCVYNLINILNSSSSYTTESNGIKSENIDGYSITYASPEKSVIEAINTEIEDNINSYLANVVIDNIPVLYRGVK